MARSTRAVLRALGAYDRAGASPKQIATDSRVPLRTVKRQLAALVREGTIAQPYFGHYTYAPGTPDILADPWGEEGLHGIVLVAESGTLDLLRGSRGPLAVELIDSPVLEAGYRERTRSWRGRLVRFRQYPTGRLVVYVAATRAPIPWGGEGGFGEFAGWLGGVLDPVDVGRALRVVEIGVHVDYRGWTLKGISAVELREFRGSLEQLYQKREAVRHEIHLAPRELALRDAVRILREGSSTAQLAEALRLEVRLAEIKPRPRPEESPPATPDLRGDVTEGYG